MESGMLTFPPFRLFLFKDFFPRLVAIGRRLRGLRGFRVNHGLGSFAPRNPVCDQQTPLFTTGGDEPKGFPKDSPVGESHQRSSRSVITRHSVRRLQQLEC